ncbi:SRPBCC family protein [Roseomonas hellenica]|uniref:SRPBCC family protein n=1 Tax=Plastoroseomonas hellenica TaxID=2687306 RepID=A0ABS5ERW8_9PROT|nr:SRPBCC family protein [Plastoroseomonas hellenica]MBR0663051.1 SRPBCC family protein [Plastoroseomonas hellenica]
MARAYASTILDAPVEAVWSVIRDFNGLSSWHPAIARSEIEDGLDADVVGCIRRFWLQDGAMVREKLLSFSDRDYSFSYNFETPAFPVENYRARVRLMPVTDTDRTFAEWEAAFDEAPEDKGKFVDIISNGVFQSGWNALKAAVAGRTAPSGARRWSGFPPNKVWCSTVIDGPADAVWNVIRDFAGMGGWHDEITMMHMIGGVRSDKVSGTRDFYFGEGHLNEKLLHLDDAERSFSYCITKSDLPWMHYVSGPGLWPVTDGNQSFAVWTGDWIASPQDDVTLIPNTEQNVYLKAFRTVKERYFSIR